MVQTEVLQQLSKSSMLFYILQMPWEPHRQVHERLQMYLGAPVDALQAAVAEKLDFSLPGVRQCAD